MNRVYFTHAHPVELARHISFVLPCIEHHKIAQTVISLIVFFVNYVFNGSSTSYLKRLATI